ncbi:hypothetical protein K469DRAFT_734275 [Zopfia rhizophila CBS 207.26]|uniref:Uncharacterized protein n=1 Tax=Zopfia rhizophila CBS 207.26 TaxID=1314779 RepID=A0A6A6EXW2_9PEZI|nr:hypothetical protein K469DRAFT_734275 [Zopfia rhizophila CBS 207.26]
MQILSTTAILLFVATTLAAPATAKARNINPPDGFIALYNQPNCPASGLENGHFSIGFEDNSCIPLGQPGILSYEQGDVQVHCTVFGDPNCQVPCANGQTQGQGDCANTSCIGASIKCAFG